MNSITNILNESDLDLSDLIELANLFLPHAQSVMGFSDPVSNISLMSDEENSLNPLGKTAYYDPTEMSITIFVDGRHPKDILRSLSHELVHHTQNCNGMFDNIGAMTAGYAQEDEHLREMEREAYELGNMCFRDWEDEYKKKQQWDLHEGALEDTLSSLGGKLKGAFGGWMAAARPGSAPFTHEAFGIDEPVDKKPHFNEEDQGPHWDLRPIPRDINKSGFLSEDVDEPSEEAPEEESEEAPEEEAAEEEASRTKRYPDNISGWRDWIFLHETSEDKRKAFYSLLYDEEVGMDKKMRIYQVYSQKMAMDGEDPSEEAAEVAEEAAPEAPEGGEGGGGEGESPADPPGAPAPAEPVPPPGYPADLYDAPDPGHPTPSADSTAPASPGFDPIADYFGSPPPAMPPGPGMPGHIPADPTEPATPRRPSPMEEGISFSEELKIRSAVRKALIQKEVAYQKHLLQLIEQRFIKKTLLMREYKRKNLSPSEKTRFVELAGIKLDEKSKRKLNELDFWGPTAQVLGGLVDQGVDMATGDEPLWGNSYMPWSDHVDLTSPEAYHLDDIADGLNQSAEDGFIRNWIIDPSEDAGHVLTGRDPLEVPFEAFLNPSEWASDRAYERFLDIDRPPQPGVRIWSPMGLGNPESMMYWPRIRDDLYIDDYTDVGQILGQGLWSATTPVEAQDELFGQEHEVAQAGVQRTRRAMDYHRDGARWTDLRDQYKDLADSDRWAQILSPREGDAFVASDMDFGIQHLNFLDAMDFDSWASGGFYADAQGNAIPGRSPLAINPRTGQRDSDLGADWVPTNLADRMEWVQTDPDCVEQSLDGSNRTCEGNYMYAVTNEELYRYYSAKVTGGSMAASNLTHLIDAGVYDPFSPTPYGPSVLDDLAGLDRYTQEQFDDDDDFDSRWYPGSQPEGSIDYGGQYDYGHATWSGADTPHERRMEIAGPIPGWEWSEENPDYGPMAPIDDIPILLARVDSDFASRLNNKDLETVGEYGYHTLWYNDEYRNTYTTPCISTNAPNDGLGGPDMPVGAGNPLQAVAGSSGASVFSTNVTYGITLAGGSETCGAQGIFDHLHQRRADATFVSSMSEEGRGNAREGFLNSIGGDAGLVAQAMGDRPQLNPAEEMANMLTDESSFYGNLVQQDFPEWNPVPMEDLSTFLTTSYEATEDLLRTEEGYVFSIDDLRDVLTRVGAEGVDGEEISDQEREILRAALDNAVLQNLDYAKAITFGEDWETAFEGGTMGPLSADYIREQSAQWVARELWAKLTVPAVSMEQKEQSLYFSVFGSGATATADRLEWAINQVETADPNAEVNFDVAELEDLAAAMEPGNPSNSDANIMDLKVTVGEQQIPFVTFLATHGSAESQAYWQETFRPILNARIIEAGPDITYQASLSELRQVEAVYDVHTMLRANSQATLLLRDELKDGVDGGAPLTLDAANQRACEIRMAGGSAGSAGCIQRQDGTYEIYDRQLLDHAATRWGADPDGGEGTTPTIKLQYLEYLQNNDQGMPALVEATLQNSGLLSGMSVAQTLLGQGSFVQSGTVMTDAGEEVPDYYFVDSERFATSSQGALQLRPAFDWLRLSQVSGAPQDEKAIAASIATALSPTDSAGTDHPGLSGFYGSPSLDPNAPGTSTLMENSVPSIFESFALIANPSYQVITTGPDGEISDPPTWSPWTIANATGGSSSQPISNIDMRLKATEVFVQQAEVRQAALTALVESEAQFGGDAMFTQQDLAAMRASNAFLLPPHEFLNVLQNHLHARAWNQYPSGASVNGNGKWGGSERAAIALQSMTSSWQLLQQRATIEHLSSNIRMNQQDYDAIVAAVPDDPNRATQGVVQGPDGDMVNGSALPSAGQISRAFYDRWWTNGTDASKSFLLHHAPAAVFAHMEYDSRQLNMGSGQGYSSGDQFYDAVLQSTLATDSGFDNEARTIAGEFGPTGVSAGGGSTPSTGAPTGPGPGPSGLLEPTDPVDGTESEGIRPISRWATVTPNSASPDGSIQNVWHAVNGQRVLVGQYAPGRGIVQLFSAEQIRQSNPAMITDAAMQEMIGDDAAVRRLRTRIVNDAQDEGAWEEAPTFYYGSGVVGSELEENKHLRSFDNKKLIKEQIVAAISAAKIDLTGVPREQLEKIIREQVIKTLHKRSNYNV